MKNESTVLAAFNDWDGSMKTAREKNTEKEAIEEKKMRAIQKKARARPWCTLAISLLLLRISMAPLSLPALNLLLVTALLSAGVMLAYHRLLMQRIPPFISRSNMTDCPSTDTPLYPRNRDEVKDVGKRRK